MRKIFLRYKKFFCVVKKLFWRDFLSYYVLNFLKINNNAFDIIFIHLYTFYIKNER